jgi:hypothetical protein
VFEHRHAACEDAQVGNQTVKESFGTELPVEPPVILSMQLASSFGLEISIRPIDPTEPFPSFQQILSVRLLDLPPTFGEFSFALLHFLLLVPQILLKRLHCSGNLPVQMAAQCTQSRAGNGQMRVRAIDRFLRFSPRFVL